MEITEIDLNKLTATQYDNLYKTLARICCTLRKNITVESAKQQANGEIVYRVKRAGAYYPYAITLDGYRLVHKAVII